MLRKSTSPSSQAVSARDFLSAMSRLLINPMPIKSGHSPKTVSKNIEELHEGPQYARTRKKFGAKKANAQAVAIALSESRKPTKK